MPPAKNATSKISKGEKSTKDPKTKVSKRWFYVTDSSSSEEDDNDDEPLAVSSISMAASLSSSSSSSSAVVETTGELHEGIGIVPTIVSTGEAVKIHETGEVGFIMSRSSDGKSYVIRIGGGSKGGDHHREVTKLRSEFRVENNMGKIMAALGQDADGDGDGGARNPRRTRQTPSTSAVTSSSSSSFSSSSSSSSSSMVVPSSGQNITSPTVSNSKSAHNVAPASDLSSSSSSSSSQLGGRGSGGGKDKKFDGGKAEINSAVISASITSREPKKKSGPGWFYVTDSSDEDNDNEDDDEATDEVQVHESVDPMTGKRLAEMERGEGEIIIQKKKKGGRVRRRSTADQSVREAADLLVVGEKRIRGNTLPDQVQGNSTISAQGLNILNDTDPSNLLTAMSYTSASVGTTTAVESSGIKRKGPGRPKVPTVGVQPVLIPSSTTGIDNELGSAIDPAGILISTSEYPPLQSLPISMNDSLQFLSNVSPRRSAAIAASAALSVRTTKQLEKAAAQRANNETGGIPAKKRKRVSDSLGISHIGHADGMDELTNIDESGDAMKLENDDANNEGGEEEEDGGGEESREQRVLLDSQRDTIVTSESGIINEIGSAIRKKKGGKQKSKATRTIASIKTAAGVLPLHSSDPSTHPLSSSDGMDEIGATNAIIDGGDDLVLDGEGRDDPSLIKKKKAGRKIGNKAVRFARAAAAAAAELASNGGFRLVPYGIDTDGGIEASLEGPDGLLSLPSLPPRGIGRSNANLLSKKEKKSPRDVAPPPLYERLSNVMRYNLMKHKEEKRTDLGPFVGRLDLPIFGDTLYKKSKERGWWPDTVVSTTTSSSLSSSTAISATNSSVSTTIIANVTTEENIPTSSTSSTQLVASTSQSSTETPIATPDKRTTTLSGQKRLRFYKLGSRRMDKLAAAVTNRWGGFGNIGPFPGELPRISRDRTPSTYVSVREWGAGARAGDASSSEEEESRFFESWDPSAPCADGIWPDGIIPQWKRSDDTRALKKAKRAAALLERPEAARGDRHELFLRANEYASDDIFDSYAAPGSSRKPPKFGMWALTSFLEREEDSILYDEKEVTAGAYVREKKEEVKHEGSDEKGSTESSSSSSSLSSSIRKPGLLSLSLSSSGKKTPSALRVSLTVKPSQDAFTLYPYERCVHCGVVRDGDADHCWNEACPLCPLTRTFEDFRIEKKKKMMMKKNSDTEHIQSFKKQSIESVLLPMPLADQHGAELLSHSLPSLRVPSLAAYKDADAAKTVIDLDALAVERIIEARNRSQEEEEEDINGGKLFESILRRSRDILRVGGEEMLISEIERSTTLTPDADNRTSAALNLHFNLSFNSSAREAFSTAAPLSLVRSSLQNTGETVNEAIAQTPFTITSGEKKNKKTTVDSTMQDENDKDDQSDEDPPMTFPSVGLPWIKGSVKALFSPPLLSPQTRKPNENKAIMSSINKLKSVVPTQTSLPVEAAPLGGLKISDQVAVASQLVQTTSSGEIPPTIPAESIKINAATVDTTDVKVDNLVDESILSLNIENASSSSATSISVTTEINTDLGRLDSESNLTTFRSVDTTATSSSSILGSSPLGSAAVTTTHTTKASPTSSIGGDMTSTLVTPAVTPKSTPATTISTSIVVPVPVPVAKVSSSTVSSSSSSTSAAAAHSFPVGERLGKAKTTPASRKRDAAALLELEINAENQFKVYHDVDMSPTDPIQKQLAAERAVEFQATEGLDPTINPGLSLFLQPPESFSNLYDVWGGKLSVNSDSFDEGRVGIGESGGEIVQIPTVTQIRNQGKAVLYSFSHMLDGNGENKKVSSLSSSEIDDLIPKSSSSTIVNEAIMSLENEMEYKLSATADAIIMSDYLLDAPVHFLGRHLHPRSMRYSDAHDIRTLPHSLGNSSYEGLVLSAQDLAKASGVTDLSHVIPIHLRSSDELIARATADEYLYTRAYSQHKNILDDAATRLAYEKTLPSNSSDSTFSEPFQQRDGGEIDHARDDLLSKASLVRRLNYPAIGVSLVNRDGCQPWARNSLEFRYSSWRNRDDHIVRDVSNVHMTITDDNVKKSITSFTHPMLDGASLLMDMAVTQLPHEDHRSMSQLTYTLVNAAHTRRQKKISEGTTATSPLTSAVAAATAAATTTTTTTTSLSVAPIVTDTVIDSSISRDQMEAEKNVSTDITVIVPVSEVEPEREADSGAV
jgi:hypothetical protein